MNNPRLPDARDVLLLKEFHDFLVDCGEDAFKDYVELIEHYKYMTETKALLLRNPYELITPILVFEGEWDSSYWFVINSYWRNYLGSRNYVMPNMYIPSV